MQKERCLKGCLKENKKVVNKKRRHPELDSGSHLVSVLESGEIPYQVRNDKFILNINAFTLIELLVVVLIIGILAAVAVPQYKLAVAKAMVSTLLGMMDAVKQAQETYYLANNTYSADFDELAVSLPGQRAPGYEGVNYVLYSPNSWKINIDGSQLIMISGTDARVPGVAIQFFYEHASHSWAGKRTCYATMSDDFANKVCKSLTHKKNRDNHNGPDTVNIYYFQ